MNLKTRRISEVSVSVGVFCCFLGAIWSPEESLKWVLTATYLWIVGRLFGLTFRREKIVGELIVRQESKLNYLNLRRKD